MESNIKPDNCPECQIPTPLQLIHTLRKELTLIGYCPNHKKEYYKLPNREWVDRKAWIKLQDEFR
ncbi:MAG: hypothetical protein PHC54_03200 [Candidatus Omnitrophica bacterium]|nr:hypothetical protein [Candidatus Omnitrophota bacterium]MDD5592444.1 hypothetical protein [Candidatus Omnitrophota bacterium]